MTSTLFLLPTSSKVKKLTPKKGRMRQATEWREPFLAVLGKSANVSHACIRAGISRQAAYRAYDTDLEFRDQWDRALEEACDVLEKEAWRRALKQSDTLLIFLLKAHRPLKYREVIQTQNRNLNLNANVTIADLAKLVHDGDPSGIGDDARTVEGEVVDG